MKVYTYAEARENFASVLDEARRGGAVRILQRDGQSFVLSPEASVASPLNVPGIDLGLTTDELVGFIRESRRAAEPTSPAEGEPA